MNKVATGFFFVAYDKFNVIEFLREFHIFKF